MFPGHCDVVPDIAYAVVENANSRVGTTLNYTCNTGFRFSDNSSLVNVTCLEYGNWSVNPDELPSCEGNRQNLSYMPKLQTGITVYVAICSRQ